MTRSYFAGGVSEQDDVQKGSFQRMVYGEYMWVHILCFGIVSS